MSQYIFNATGNSAIIQTMKDNIIMAETQTETVKKSRKKFCVKVYVDAKGEESRHANPSVDRLEFRFIGTDGKPNGKVVKVKLTEIGKDCAKAAAWHGVAQKIGDSYNKAETADEAQEATETMLERLVANEWVKAGEGAGPKTNVLVMAIVNAIEKAEGKDTVSAERMDTIRAKVSKKEGRDGAMANEAIHAEYKQLQAESAAKRAKEAASKAKTTTDTLEGF